MDNEETKGHPAAAILREIAEVAEWHPEPQKEFETKIDGEWGGHIGYIGGFVAFTANNPALVRRKPRTKRIGNYDVPLPGRKVPGVGTEYWVASADSTTYRFRASWFGDTADHKRLSRDLVHLDPDSAEIHGRALASLMKEDEE